MLKSFKVGVERDIRGTNNVIIRIDDSEFVEIEILTSPGLVYVYMRRFTSLSKFLLNIRRICIRLVYV